ncbi:AAA family ATPase [Planctomicrobium sp. SH661]|uniref:AAA family ATPase n=1 Tax=Planctomicrobium sp. SH661 TaxID=3448124 RepID=UPI003F5B8AA1
MNTATALEDLRLRILAGYPILLLQTYEEQRWEDELANLALEIERGLVTWSATAGPLPILESEPLPTVPGEFLAQIAKYPDDHLFLLKDLHLHLNEPGVIRKLRDLLPHLVSHRKTLLLMSPLENLPVELIKDVTVIELPFPGIDEMRGQLHSLLAADRGERGTTIDPRLEDRLVQAVLGLTLTEARNAFSNVLQGSEEITEELFPKLVAEKRHLVQGSNLLEFFDLEEGLGDIGGLDGLKEWIQQRANAFTSDAQSRGITSPRGVLLAGVQGCGKSLSARAIARILGFPLMRMDIGALLESTRGTSEQNMRDVLRLMDTIAPAVLWLEEIDKAFGGYDTDAGGDATMSRLVGRFLTWLQEHTAPVFVVATANKVSSLPPELLRRGRFDELFFVDLPNFQERCEIFRIHLSKRGWKPEKFDIEELAEGSDGYSGAEIEEIVNSAIIESFAQNRMPTQKDLDDARERTVPLSVTMEDEIFHLREWARTRCRAATTESRVMEVLEEEHRRGELPQLDERHVPKWVELAEHGQLAAAIVEHVRLLDHVSWPQLLQDFSPYADLRGEHGLVLRADPKVAICIRISRELADILCEYIDGRRLYLHPVPLMEVAPSERPQIPAIEALPPDRVNKPVWLPTKLRLVPPPTGSGRMAHVARIKMGK